MLLLKILQWFSNTLGEQSKYLTMASHIHTICDLATACLFGLLPSTLVPSPFLLATMAYLPFLHLVKLVSTLAPLPRSRFSGVSPSFIQVSLQMLPSSLAPLSEVTLCPHVTPCSLTLFFIHNAAHEDRILC